MIEIRSKDLINKKRDELTTLLENAQTKLLELRIRQKIASLKDASEIRKTRKLIARILTQIRYSR